MRRIAAALGLMLGACQSQPLPCEAAPTSLDIPAGALSFTAQSQTAYLYSLSDDSNFAIKVYLSAAENACEEQALWETTPKPDPARYFAIYIDEVAKPESFPMTLGTLRIGTMEEESGDNYAAVIDKTPGAPPHELGGGSRVDVTSGSVTIDTVDAERVSGSYDVSFETGERAQGSFDAPLCSPRASASTCADL